MKHANILVVEDDPGIQDMLKYSLSAEGYTLYHAYTVKEGWETIENKAIDLVLLDWMLPDNSGIDLLHRIRKYHSMLPVIMVTAKTEEDDRILGLDVGADDYVTKPFSLRELLARIRAVLRRGDSEVSEKVKIGKLDINFSTYNAAENSVPVNLSSKEFDILNYLWNKRNKTVSRDELLSNIWGEDVYTTPRTIDNFILKIRQKTENNPNEPKIIITIHGIGYKLLA